MKKTHSVRNYFLLIIIFFGLLGCKPMDLRSPELKAYGLTEENMAKGQALLKAAVEAQNLEALRNYHVYSLKARDEWYKQYGMNFNPWPGDNGALLEYQMAFDTFDNRVTWLEGEMEGEIYGIQSWQIYHQGRGEEMEKVKHKKIRFMLPTMHYFMELPYRLSKAPIISYMGEEILNGIPYHRVFATWDSPEANQHDQYILYIHPETELVERTTYTIRDNYMWTPKNFYGTAVYSDFRKVDEVMFPFQMDVYPFDHTQKKKVHSFRVEQIRLDEFDHEDLYPFAELPRLGDQKTLDK